MLFYIFKFIIMRKIFSTILFVFLLFLSFNYANWAIEIPAIN